MGSLVPYEAGRIAQYFRKREGRIERMDEYFYIDLLFSMEPWAAPQKKNYYGGSTGFPGNGYLLRVSRQSRLSANNKGDNEMILGAVHRSSSNYHTAEENSRKLRKTID